MVQSLNRIFIILIVVFAWLLLGYGCYNTRVVVADKPAYRRVPPPQAKHGPPPWAPAHGYRAKYHYRYYPSSCVYLDTGRDLYFYYDNGNWQVSVSLPTWIRIDFNDYVTLEMGTGTPYEYHHEVVKKYPPGQQKKKWKTKGKGKWS